MQGDPSGPWKQYQDGKYNVSIMRSAEVKVNGRAGPPMLPENGLEHCRILKSERAKLQRSASAF